MPRLHIVFDREGRIDWPSGPPPDVKVAMLDIADDIEAIDIYAIARKLAELLLEQIRD